MLGSVVHSLVARWVQQSTAGAEQKEDVTFSEVDFSEEGLQGTMILFGQRQRQALIDAEGQERRVKKCNKRLRKVAAASIEDHIRRAHTDLVIAETQRKETKEVLFRLGLVLKMGRLCRKMFLRM